MKKPGAVLVATVALVSLAGAAGPWDGAYSALRGEYLIYSGSLGETAAPTAGDRKAAFAIRGEAAKKLFESIGPDLEDACGASSGMRMRQKGDLDCFHDKANRESPYVCHFGIDLRTGKSIHGSIC